MEIKINCLRNGIEQGGGEANFGGFVKPGESFENLDKKKFYLCTEKGYYANKFCLYNNRKGILKWDWNTNKWFILAKGTGKAKPRTYVNKAIRLTDLRVGDKYYAQNIIWILGGEYYINDGQRQRYQTYKLTGRDLFVVTVSQEMISEIRPYMDSCDKQELATALDIICNKYSNGLSSNTGTISTESPFVKIIQGNVVRTHVCFPAQWYFYQKNSTKAYDYFLDGKNAVQFLRYVRKSNGKEKTTTSPITGYKNIRHFKYKMYLKNVDSTIDNGRYTYYVRKCSHTRKSFGQVYRYKSDVVSTYRFFNTRYSYNFNIID